MQLLKRVEHDNQVVTWQSPRLMAVGVVHAFTTRLGGISPKPFDSLNLGQAGCLPGQMVGDSQANIEANLARLTAALDVPNAPIARVRQVHGADVSVADQSRTGVVLSADQADAIVTQASEVLLMIRVADCVPVLLAQRQGTVVAAVHAGWRGAVAGVVPAAIAAMRQRFGVEPTDLVAAVGPCIGLKHFEVGPQVAAAFEQTGLADAVDRGFRPRPHVDLKAAVYQQLTQAGVPGQAIDVSGTCTFADAAYCFSHRRDRGQTGRLAAVIARASRR